MSEGPEYADHGVVDPYVDRPQLLLDPRGRKLDLLRIRDICGCHQGFAAVGLHFALSAFQAFDTPGQQAYIGTRFNIEDADGFLWRYDDDADAYVQFKSDGTGARTGNTVSAVDLTITSFDHGTGAVEFGGSGSLSGTVVQGGIGVLTSNFYGEFANDAALQQAIDDIDAAVNTVNSRGYPITADATLIDANVQLINEKVRQLDDEKRRITREELDETAAVSRAANLKLRLAINNINIMSQMSSGLIENMLQLTAGPSRGPGVFGILGL